MSKNMKLWCTNKDCLGVIETLKAKIKRLRRFIEENVSHDGNSEHGCDVRCPACEFDNNFRE